MKLIPSDYINAYGAMKGMVDLESVEVASIQADGGILEEFISINGLEGLLSHLPRPLVAYSLFIYFGYDVKQAARITRHAFDLSNKDLDDLKRLHQSVFNDFIAKR